MAKAMGADQFTSDAAELMAVPDYDKKVLQQKVRLNLHASCCLCVCLLLFLYVCLFLQLSHASISLQHF